ncbi:macrolide family glycosyltransferase [Clostridium paraputrificum]|uniref:macrolide family glycosyltransferase n=1 Tax=Clostridium paraputrificum TaxID=29363 RepID=UPI00232DFD60|nr:macrolide family glycosyltransferase [Clostridium paraputrificum]MDB2106777.1 glycosyltransferase [Clostridium paraputrificum]MDB2113490.1 glycosyltransferase [Clostridium paraputrificum]
MSKIVFFCIPAHGHTNPTLGVVRELISRGHQVFYYSYNMMREKIEATGATFVSCDEYDQEQRLDAKDAVRVGKDLAFSTQILVDTTLALNDTVCEHMRELNPDCIVADSMAVWGKAVALKLGIPFVSSTTTFAFNQYSAKIMKQSLGKIFGMILSMSKINKNIKRLQDKGYPVKSVLDIIQNDNNTDTIVYTSPEFQPCAETFSEKYVFVGPSIRPAENKVEKTANKLIYISMGTVINDSIDFYKKCIKALADTEYQVIISVGNLINIEELGVIPDNITISRFVDQIAVLSQSDLFLTHCGMNSVNESLYYKVPLVMFPQTSEQDGVATRVEQLGAGVRLKHINAKSIKETIENVLNTKSYYEQASKISQGFHKCTGAKGAADKIEQMCK